MKQTQLESWIEVFLNYLSGFVLAFLLYQFVVLPNPEIRDNSLLAVGLFTAVSVIRSYLWRRFFNAGLHKLVHTFVAGLFKAKLIRVT